MVFCSLPLEQRRCLPMPGVGTHLGNDLHLKRTTFHADAHSTQDEALTGNPAYHSLTRSIPLAGIWSRCQITRPI
jgi:hypothetical protein